MLKLMVNDSPLARRWDDFKNLNTGRTLYLEPGEEAEVDVPADFEDPYLKPAPTRAASRRADRHAPEEPTAPDEPAEAGDKKEK